MIHTQNQQATVCCTVKNTYLKSSCHRTDTTTVVCTHQGQSRRVPTRWVRTIHLLTPLQGLNRPSIPPPFHWCEEKCSQTFSEESWIFLFFLFKTNDLHKSSFQSMSTTNKECQKVIVPFLKLYLKRTTTCGVCFDWPREGIHDDWRSEGAGNL